MKFNDALTGAVLLVLGVTITWHVQAFPEMPGQKFGPAWFPAIAALGLAACGLALIVRGVSSAAPAIALEAWTRRARPVAAFLSVPAGLAFYALAANTLGFHLTGMVLLLAWMRLHAVRWPPALTVAVIAPLAIHLVFYKLLRVPLPWGVFERFAF